MEFLGKNILITGGSSGIGLSCARLFNERGATVYVLDKKEFVFTNNNIHFFSCDISDFNQVDHAIKKINAITPVINYVFANAGIYLLANILDTSEIDLENILAVNLKGVIYTLQCVLPIMKLQKHGSIVLMGSDQTFIAKSNSALYGAIKAAIGHLAKSTALDYAPFNIRANCICPASIDTPLYHNVVDILVQKSQMSREDIETQILSSQLISRLGKPEEVSELVAFLCSDKSSFINGALINIDGGLTVR